MLFRAAAVLVAPYQQLANEPIYDSRCRSQKRRTLRNNCLTLATLETTMKPGNFWHINNARARRGVNTPVLLLIAGLGGFWATVAFLIFA